MEWTKERPTQPGVYWMHKYDITIAIAAGYVVGQLMFDVPGYNVPVESSYFNDAYWQGPITPPAPPIKEILK